MRAALGCVWMNQLSRVQSKPEGSFPVRQVQRCNLAHK